jgi:hypothetical protein
MVACGRRRTRLIGNEPALAARVFELDFLPLSQFVREGMVEQRRVFLAYATAGIDVDAAIACPDDPSPLLEREKRE